jgi:TonB family protein
MEAFGLYLLKSVIWLSGFALIYILFLKNERFFLLNRVYLLSGILASLLLPLVTLHYIVFIPHETAITSGEIIQTGSFPGSNTPGLSPVIFAGLFYIAGVLFVTSRIIIQNKSVLKAIKKSPVINSHPVKLIRTDDYESSFSYFSYVFVNPSVPENEKEEIVNHELAHIRQLHWIDLVLVEILCVLQWFNPFIWIYIRFVRQNHEYLADEMALQRTSDPARYRAALLNQIVGTPVFSLANSFNYSLNKKRFTMMKNIIRSPWRKMKVFLVLPVFAIVFYAFAKPEYRYTVPDGPGINQLPATQQKDAIKGIVIQKDGKPLPGAILQIKGTTVGTTTDAKGEFALSGVPSDGTVFVSFVGFKMKAVKPVFKSAMKIEMIRDTIELEGVSTPPPPPLPQIPPPPPPTYPGVKGSDKALVVIDGKVTENARLKEIDPGTIENMEILTGEKVITKYGDKAKDGVIVITTKNNLLPPPPPPPPFDAIAADKEHMPLILIDGVETTKIDLEKIDQGTINTIAVLKDESAIAVFGDKGRNGVVIITLKKDVPAVGDTKISKPDAKQDGDEQKVVKEKFLMVEEAPHFPGGSEMLNKWLEDNIKYPAEAVKKNITGQVLVDLIIGKDGRVSNARVSKPVNPLLDAEALRLINSMPAWNPGKQGGKSVDVDVRIPINFTLK